jgi:hypothetical protein
MGSEHQELQVLVHCIVPLHLWSSIGGWMMGGWCWLDGMVVNQQCWRRLVPPPSRPGSRLANLARGRRDNRRGLSIPLLQVDRWKARFLQRLFLGLISTSLSTWAEVTFGSSWFIQSYIASNCRVVLWTAVGGSESPGTEMNGGAYDFTSKLLHLAWHPMSNVIACAASNSLYMYYA